MQIPAKSTWVPMPTLGTLRRKCACGGSGGECAECQKKKLQRRAAGDGPEMAPPIVHDVLRSPGKPLDAQTRAFFEPRFGHDFSKVRVHSDAEAARSAHAVDALAYTVGPQIVFGSGQFRPGTSSGRALLAHELTHVTQQDGSVGFPLRLASPLNQAEREAERSASAIMGGHLGGPTGSVTGVLQRQESNAPVAGSPGSGGPMPAKPSAGVGASLCAAHPDETYYKTNPGYCQDTSSTGSLHAGYRCYREIPTGGGCPPGKHVCFDSKTGKCDPGQTHIDDTAPSISRASTGLCDLSWLGLCSMEHLITDVIPDLLAKGTKTQAECIETCQKMSRWVQPLCMQDCIGGMPAL